MTLTPAEIAQANRQAAFFRSPEFIRNFAAVRLYMRDLGEAVSNDEVAEKLGVDASLVNLIYAFVDAFEASDRLIEASTPPGPKAGDVPPSRAIRKLRVPSKCLH